MCSLTGVSRASYYRHLEMVAPDEEQMVLRQAIQEIVLAHHRRYGYRRVTMDLHHRVEELEEEVRRLVPGRRHFSATPENWPELRRELKRYRIGLAPVLLTGEPNALRRAAWLRAPRSWPCSWPAAWPTRSVRCSSCSTTACATPTSSGTSSCWGARPVTSSPC